MAAPDSSHPSLTPELLVSWLADALALARARLHDRHLAEDAVQEACADALAKRDRVRGGADDARAWFLTLVINRCRMIRRSLHRRTARTVAATDDARSGIAAIPDPDLGEALAAALASLPERERQAVELRFLGGLDFRDIASALGRPEKTVRSHVDRGLARLRAALPRVGLHAGGPPALGVLLTSLPRPAPSAELVAAVGRVPAITRTGTAAVPTMAKAWIATAAAGVLVAGGTWWWSSQDMGLESPPVAAEASPPVDPRLPVSAAAGRMIGTGPFQAGGRLYGISFNPSGSRLAWWSRASDPGLGYWRIDDGSQQAVAVPAGTQVYAATWLDDRRLAAAVRCDQAPAQASEILLIDEQAGVTRRLALPTGTLPFDLTASPERRWLVCAAGSPAGQARRRTAQDDAAEPVVGVNGGVVVIDAHSGTVAERIGPLADVGVGDAVCEAAVDDGCVAAVITGIMDNDPGGGPRTSCTLVVWDRQAQRIALRRDLPMRGFEVEDVSRRGAVFTVRYLAGGSPRTAVVDPAHDGVTLEQGWSVGCDGAEVCRVERGGLHLPSHRPIALGDLRDHAVPIASRDHVAVLNCWQPTVIETSTARVLTPFGPAFPGPADDLDWAGDRLAVRFGDRVLGVDGDRCAAWLADGRISQWNPFATSPDRVVIGRGGQRIKLIDVPSGTVLATVGHDGRDAEWASLAPDGSRFLIAWAGDRAGHGPGELILYEGGRGDRLASLPLDLADARFAQLRASWSSDAGTVYLASYGSHPSGAFDARTGRSAWIARERNGQPLTGVTELVPTGHGPILARCRPSPVARPDDPATVYLLAPDGTMQREIADPGDGMVVCADGTRAVGTRGVVDLGDGTRTMTWKVPPRRHRVSESRSGGAALINDVGIPEGIAVPSPGGGWIALLVGSELVVEDTAGAGFHLRYALGDVPDKAGMPRVRWNRAEDRLAIGWPQRLPATLVDLFAPGGLAVEAARRALEGDAPAAAAGALAEAGIQGRDAIADRPIDARQVLAWERMAAAGMADRRMALSQLANEPGPLAAFARDVLARLAARVAGPRHPPLAAPAEDSGSNGF